MTSGPSGAVASLTEICACNNCGHSESRCLFTERYQMGETQVLLGIRRCRQCGLVYVSPRLSPEAMSFVYRGDAQATISHSYCWNGAADGWRFGGILRRLKATQPEGRLLDIGCGAGQFLAEAQRTGRWTVAGLEPDPDAAACARQVADCLVYNATLDDVALESGSLDVVTMFGVLEHLHDPLGVLMRVHRLLRPGGVLAVYVPNYHYLRLRDTGMVARLRTGRWSNLHPQEHLFQYTPQSVRRMLSNAGFQCLTMDIGRPFLNGGGTRRMMKLAAYYLACGAKRLSGIHLGGIEILARRIAQEEIGPRLRRTAA